MKITEVEAFALRAPFARDGYWGARSWGNAADVCRHTEIGAPAFARWEPAYEDVCATTVVRISCDSGHTGWGEAKAPVAPEICRDIIHRLLRDTLLGQDPRDVQPAWDRMYGRMALRNQGAGFFLEAVSALDIALWDLVGNLLREPACRLLGGRYRERIPVYASGVVGLRSTTDPPERVVAEAAAFVDLGFQGVKVALGHGVVVDNESLGLVRGVVGDSVALLADVAGRYDLAQALQLVEAIQEHRLFLLEAPLPAELRSGYATLASATNLPLAIDLIGTRWQTLDFLRDASIAVIQPDVSRAGGLSECRRVADLASAFGVACMPHMSISSTIHQAACVQFAASLPTIHIMEYWVGSSPLSSPELGTSLQPDGGYLAVPDGPGLGIELDEERLLSYSC